MKPKQILDNYRIPYITKGPNVKKGWINIKCPFCSNPPDPSHHLNINPKTGYYSCWRSPLHNGTFHYLIKTLVGEDVYLENIIPTDLEFLNEFMDKSSEVKSIQFDPWFRDIKPSGREELYYNYLAKRGFDNVEEFCKYYSIKCCTHGYWSHRIIFPLMYNGKLVSWTSRAIIPTEKKYLETSKEESVVHPGECIYNFDQLYQSGGKILYITEGVLDALKIDYYSKYRATCLFTLRIKSDMQKLVLARLAKRFEQFVICLDKGAELESVHLLDSILPFKRYTTVMYLPEGVEDPGEMTKNQVQKVFA